MHVRRGSLQTRWEHEGRLRGKRTPGVVQQSPGLCRGKKNDHALLDATIKEGQAHSYSQ